MEVHPVQKKPSSDAEDRAITQAPLRSSFNPSVEIKGQGEQLTKIVGVVALRELDERLGLTEWLASRLHDTRAQDVITHPLVELIRTRLYLMGVGQHDQNDADRHRHDPACRLAVSSRRGLTPLETPADDENMPDGLPSQPTQSRLIAMLTSKPNLSVLDEGLFEFTRRDIISSRKRRFRSVTIDIDSFPIQVYGNQDGSAYNGYYRVQCYHPIIAMLGETGHWLAADLRPGNVHTADGAEEFVLQVIEKVNGTLGVVAAVRGDAGFPEEGLLSALERKKIKYVFRIKKNPVLARLAKPHLKRPCGRPTKEPRIWFRELEYKAGSWSRKRRIVLVVKELPGQLFLDYFFLITNWSASSKPASQLLEYYRRRGSMEGHIGEMKSVLDPALSCTTRPKSHIRGRVPKKRVPSRDAELANEATFLLYGQAYNLLNGIRRIVSKEEPRENADSWSIKCIREWVLEAQARLTITARRARFIVNESLRDLWRALWYGFARLQPVTDTS